MTNREKVSSTFRPESETAEWRARSFMLNALPFDLSPEKQNKLTTKELFELYAAVINSEPNLDALKALADKAGVAGSADSEANFKKFLTIKLPAELIKNLLKSERVNSEEDIPLETLERVHKAREKIGARMVLGYHVANREYTGEVPQSKLESVTISDGKEITVPAGNAHYSVSPKGIYKLPLERGGEKFLYLVEGSSSDFSKSNETYTKAHGSRGWVSTARPLPIIFKTKLDNELEKELGLERA